MGGFYLAFGGLCDFSLNPLTFAHVLRAAAAMAARPPALGLRFLRTRVLAGTAGATFVEVVLGGRQLRRAGPPRSVGPWRRSRRHYFASVAKLDNSRISSI